MIELAPNIERTPEIEDLLVKLNNKKWRLNNLYYIKDKKKRVRVMKLNHAQRVLADETHPLTIIPKSRQQGISTYKLADQMDDCLFEPGTDAGVQSYGKDEAKKLSMRAKLMWDKFDPDIKMLLGVDLGRSNDTGLYFNNGSVLKIGNFRGDTLQALHVSELAKIDVRFPEKSEELKTGAFEAVAVGNKISIESTSEGPIGLFYDMCMSAKKKQDKGQELSPLDFKLIFLPWYNDPDCWLDFEVEVRKEVTEYLDKLESTLNITIEPEQRWWYEVKSERLKSKMKREYPSTLEEAFEQSLEGTVFQDEYENMMEHKRILPNLAVPRAPTYLSYDIGVNDTCVLHFAQIIEGKARIVYTYANKREGIPFYMALCDKLGFNIKMVFLPHDVNVMEFGTGLTRLETFQSYGITCVVIDRMFIKDYMEVLREFFLEVYIDENDCDELVGAIQTYRWKFDKRLQVFLQIPEHDESSNFIDSFKYMAIGLKKHGDFRKTVSTNQRHLGRKTPSYRETGYCV